MNHSLYSADRMTHLKIVVVALIAAVVVASVGISVRLSSDDRDAPTARVAKAGKVVTASSSSANRLEFSGPTHSFRYSWRT